MDTIEVITKEIEDNNTKYQAELGKLTSAKSFVKMSEASLERIVGANEGLEKLKAVLVQNQIAIEQANKKPSKKSKKDKPVPVEVSTKDK